MHPETLHLDPTDYKHTQPTDGRYYDELYQRSPKQTQVNGNHMQKNTLLNISSNEKTLEGDKPRMPSPQTQFDLRHDLPDFEIELDEPETQDFNIKTENNMLKDDISVLSQDDDTMGDMKIRLLPPKEPGFFVYVIVGIHSTPVKDADLQILGYSPVKLSVQDNTQLPILSQSQEDVEIDQFMDFENENINLSQDEFILSPKKSNKLVDASSYESALDITMDQIPVDLTIKETPPDAFELQDLPMSTLLCLISRFIK
jgi:hypothetical protein